MDTLTWAESIAKGNQQRAASIFGLTEHFVAAEWVELFESSNRRCVRCGADNDLSADHIAPLVRGGKNTIDNIQILCRQCNSRKALKSTDYLLGSERPCVVPIPDYRKCENPKQKYNFRLSDHAKELLELMAKNLGITQTAALELSIRHYAFFLGVTPEPGDILKRVAGRESE